MTWTSKLNLEECCHLQGLVAERLRELIDDKDPDMLTEADEEEIAVLIGISPKLGHMIFMLEAENRSGGR